MKHRKNASFFFFAIVIFLLSGCGSSAPVPISHLSEIVGTWKTDPPGTAIRILPDGTILGGFTVDTIGESSHGEHKIFFEEGLMILSGPSNCREIMGSYEVQMLPSGNLKFSLVEDECIFRRSVYPGQSVEPVIPKELIRVE